MVTSGHWTFVLILECGVCPWACAGVMAQTLRVLWQQMLVVHWWTRGLTSPCLHFSELLLHLEREVWKHHLLGL